MKTRTCTCRDYEFNGTCEHLTPVPVENWEMEFREYFDKTLKPKKPTIKNLDRELLVDFIRKLLIKEREEAYDNGVANGASQARRVVLETAIREVEKINTDNPWRIQSDVLSLLTSLKDKTDI